MYVFHVALRGRKTTVFLATILISEAETKNINQKDFGVGSSHTLQTSISNITKKENMNCYIHFP